jgi:DNA-binding NarL/FixJ family response regulator
MSVRVLLVDDHRMFLDGLRPLLQRTPGIQVVGEAQDGARAVALAQELAADVVIMDVAMPRLNGIEATRQLRSQRPDCQVIVLSMHSDRRYVIEALRAGARGYLLKDSAFTDLASAIRIVTQGRICLSDRIQDSVLSDYITSLDAEAASPFDTLSPREREVLQLLAEGRSTKQIAAHLNVSGKTVETHRRQVMEKLELYTVAELTKYAIRQGLTGLE